jgi:hypothetical protein
MKKKTFIGAVLFFYFLAVASFLIAQLSTVSNTIMSHTVLNYHYPLRIAIHCLSIICIMIGSILWKTNSGWKTAIKIILSVGMIAFVVIWGFPNNTMA